MQVLNDRLANYLEKVRQLEQENAQLESRIREWYECQIPYICPDYQSFFKTAEDLQQKVMGQVLSSWPDSSRKLSTLRLSQMELKLTENSGRRALLSGTWFPGDPGFSAGLCTLLPAILLFASLS